MKKNIRLCVGIICFLIALCLIYLSGPCYSIISYKQTQEIGHFRMYGIDVGFIVVPWYIVLLCIILLLAISIIFISVSFRNIKNDNINKYIHIVMISIMTLIISITLVYFLGKREYAAILVKQSINNDRAFASQLYIANSGDKNNIITLFDVNKNINIKLKTSNRGREYINNMSDAVPYTLIVYSKNVIFGGFGKIEVIYQGRAETSFRSRLQPIDQIIRETLNYS